MSDDIVTRLRELAAKQDAKWCDPTDAPLTMYQVAANEIERLQSENASLRHAISEQNRLNRLTNITGTIHE